MEKNKKREVPIMPRRKKEELVNALADADQESLQSMSGETDDDLSLIHI